MFAVLVGGEGREKEEEKEEGGGGGAVRVFGGVSGEDGDCRRRKIEVLCW